MKKIILLLVAFSVGLAVHAQQFGNGYVTGISNFNAPLLSGAYAALSLQPNFPAAMDNMWAYLLTERTITEKNFQMQMASLMLPDDRLFFRKLAVEGLFDAPDHAQWHELATRGSNSFTGDQRIATDRMLYFGDLSDPDKWARMFCNSFGHLYFDLSSRITLRNVNNGHPIAYLQANGDFYLGTVDAAEDRTRVFVNGSIFTKEIQIKSNVWADYVFKDDYRLPSLSEVKRHIEEKRHLPDIPSETEVKEKGVNLGDMQVKLLQKIEELTLYLIRQDEKIQLLESKLNTLNKE
jgi:hypothetical protein